MAVHAALFGLLLLHPATGPVILHGVSTALNVATQIVQVARPINDLAEGLFFNPVRSILNPPRRSTRKGY